MGWFDTQWGETRGVSQPLILLGTYNIVCMNIRTYVPQFIQSYAQHMHRPASSYWKILRRPTETKLASKKSRQGCVQIFFQNLGEIEPAVKPVVGPTEPLFQRPKWKICFSSICTGSSKNTTINKLLHSNYPLCSSSIFSSYYIPVWGTSSTEILVMSRTMDFIQLLNLTVAMICYLRC